MGAKDTDGDFQRLLARAQEGSQEAARELTDRYGPHIIRAVRRKLNRAIRSRFDSIDFVQAVWASFFASPVAIADFQHPNDLVHYLVGLARHKVVDELRRHFYTERCNVNRERSLNDPAENLKDRLYSRLPTPSQVAMAEDLWRHALRNKPEHYQRILKLRRKGDTVPQIAEKVGVNEKTVRRILHRAFTESD